MFRSYTRGLIFLSLLFLLCAPASAFVLGGEADFLPAAKQGENLAPIAQNDALKTYRNVAIDGQLRAYDPEGDLLTFRIIKPPARGAIAFSEEEASHYTYTPYEDKTGRDVFTYVAIDSRGNESDVAEISLVIEDSDEQYSDMQTNPAHKAAVQLAEEELLIGYRIGDEQFFEPNTAVSREQFLTLAMQSVDAALLEDVVKTGFYDDEHIAVWAKPYVATALYTGTVSGQSTDEGVAFLPTESITKSEAAVILDHLLALSDVAVAEGSTAPTWAAQSAANLDAVGALPHGDTETLTRADAAVMLAAALDILEARESSRRWLFW